MYLSHLCVLLAALLAGVQTCYGDTFWSRNMFGERNIRPKRSPPVEVPKNSVNFNADYIGSKIKDIILSTATGVEKFLEGGVDTAVDELKAKGERILELTVGALPTLVEVATEVIGEDVKKSFVETVKDIQNNLRLSTGELLSMTKGIDDDLVNYIGILGSTVVKGSEMVLMAANNAGNFLTRESEVLGDIWRPMLIRIKNFMLSILELFEMVKAVALSSETKNRIKRQTNTNNYENKYENYPEIFSEFQINTARPLYFLTDISPRVVHQYKRKPADKQGLLDPKGEIIKKTGYTGLLWPKDKATKKPSYTDLMRPKGEKTKKPGHTRGAKKFLDMNSY